MPALAQTHPGPVSTISTALSIRTMRLVWRSTSSTARGSLSHRAAKLLASGEGSMSFRLTMRPSALETIFWQTTRISPSRSCKSIRVERCGDQIGEIVARHRSWGCLRLR